MLQKFPPILLFSPIRLLILQKFSHLYFYSVLYVYSFLRKLPTYIFIQTRRLFGTLEYYAQQTTDWAQPTPPTPRRWRLWRETLHTKETAWQKKSEKSGLLTTCKKKEVNRYLVFTKLRVTTDFSAARTHMAHFNFLATRKWHTNVYEKRMILKQFLNFFYQY